MKKCTLIILVSLLQVHCVAQVKIAAVSNIIPSTTDRFPLISYELYEGKKYKLKEKPRALFFYIQGSEAQTVTTKISYLASAVILGCRAIMLEKRGCFYNRVDTTLFNRYDTKQQRILDCIDVLNTYLKEVPTDIPVVIVGGSEGGDVAAALATKEKRITQLILIGSGGGWSQETELKFMVKKYPGYLNVQTPSELDTIFKTINASGNDSLLWAGHSYKRWKSYLKDSSATYVQQLAIPVLLLHGDADKNVPVESARALNTQLKACDKQNLTYIEYKGLDHTLYNEQTHQNGYPFLEIDIMNWLMRQSLLSEKELNTFTKRVKRAHRDLF